MTLYFPLAIAYFIYNPPMSHWKQAALEAVDHKAVEKAFMDQSYGFVSNKAEILFQDPYRLGFEIIHRNDKATKMVAMFAFRVGDAALYIPVFFLNGTISGADMIYRGDVKRIVPLTEEWCTRLVTRGRGDEGRGVSRGNASPPSPTHLDRLANPQGYYKSASVPDPLRALMDKSAAENTFDYDAAWRVLTEETGNAPVPLLTDFLAEAGPDSLNKVAEMLGPHPVALRYLAEHYDAADLVPEERWELNEAQAREQIMAKQAAALEAHLDAGALVLYNDIVPGVGMSKEASAHLFKRGYAFEDARVPKHRNVVYEGSGEIEMKVSTPGVYDVLLKDGTSKRMILLRQGTGAVCLGIDNYPSESSPYGCKMDTTSLRLVQTDGKTQECGAGVGNILGSCVGKFGRHGLDGGEDFLVDPKSAGKGNYYVAVDTGSGDASSPFLVLSNEADGKNRKLEITYGYSSKTIFYADEQKGFEDSEIIGPDCKFVEIAAEKDREVPSGDCHYFTTKGFDQAIATDYDARQWVFSGEKSPLDLQITKSAFDPDGYNVIANFKPAKDLSHRSAMVKLSADLGLSVDTASEILDRVDREGPLDLLLVADTMEKRAYATQVINSPNWEVGYDSTFGVPLDTPQVQILDTYTPAVPMPEPRYGDKWEQESPFSGAATEVNLPGDAFSTISPEELARISDAHSLPHVFDHGVLGALATKTFDAIAQVDKYLPKIEEGVDHLGRILFLFRYRPADFESAYGTDDMQDMESELSSVFQSTGAMLLTLLQSGDERKKAPQVIV